MALKLSSLTSEATFRLKSAETQGQNIVLEMKAVITVMIHSTQTVKNITFPELHSALSSEMESGT